MTLFQLFCRSFPGVGLQVFPVTHGLGQALLCDLVSLYFCHSFFPFCRRVSLSSACLEKATVLGSSRHSWAWPLGTGQCWGWSSWVIAAFPRSWSHPGEPDADSLHWMASPRAWTLGFIQRPGAVSIVFLIHPSAGEMGIEMRYHKS